MKTNKAGLELIKEFEGFRSNAYLCPAGVWTIGYGTTRINGLKVKPGSTATREMAERYLQADLATFERNVKKLVRVPLNDNQFSALVSFTYNCGVGAFANSTLLRLLNQGHYNQVRTQLMRWNKAGGRELAGLTRRRKAEADLFEKSKSCC